MAERNRLIKGSTRTFSLEGYTHACLTYYQSSRTVVFLPRSPKRHIKQLKSKKQIKTKKKEMEKKQC